MQLGLVALVLVAACASPSATLIDEGRTLLDAGDAQAAVARFERADALEHGSTGTRVWLVRGWLALDRIDDSLQATDELKQAGAPQPDLDYLYGLGFHARAVRAVSTGSGGAFTQGEFEDAKRFLAKAVEADAVRYDDAYLPLAESGWYAQDLATANQAVLRAIELQPTRPEAHLMHGRIAFSSYSQARTDDAPQADLERHWSEALDAFQAARDAGLARGDATGRARAVEAAQQIGLLHVWKSQPEEAAIAYADAMVLDPWAVDYNAVIGYVGLETFLAELLPARDALAAAQGPEAPGLAVMDWWAGFGQFGQGDMPAAEASFERVLAVNPDYTSAWYYLFRAAYGQRHQADAVAALRTAWHQAPDELVGLIESEPDLNLAILEYLIGWLSDAEKQSAGARPREAALLAEVMTRVRPEEARYWNNLGLFLRDYGEALELETPAARAEDLAPLWEGAFDAYSRTLELEPDNAGYLNDTAVMLHYHLHRDYELALDMYARARELAEAELEREDISNDHRDWMRIARRDARNNFRLLSELMEGDAPEHD